jgi:hypothetical protein
MKPRFVGRHRTLDGAPHGPRPRIESWNDLLIYRDEQWELMKRGIITEALYRKRVRRWCQRYRELAMYRHLLQERDRERAATTEMRGEN